MTTPSTDFTKLPSTFLYVVKVDRGGEQGNWQNIGATFDPELASLLKAQLERVDWKIVHVETVKLYAQSVEVLPREVKVTVIESEENQDE